MADRSGAGVLVASARVTVAIGLVSMATAAAVVLGGGNPVVAVAPVLAVVVVSALWRSPLRWGACALLAIALGLHGNEDSPAAMLWVSPLLHVGAPFFDNLSQLIGWGIPLSVLDLLVLLMLAIVLYRRWTGSQIDGERVPIARPILLAALAYGLVLVLWAGLGLLRGGNPSAIYWQTRELAFVPVLVWVFQGALRGPSDLRTLGGIIVGAACVKSVVGAWFYFAICVPRGWTPPHVSSHGDSILFTLAVMVVLVRWIEERSMPRGALLALGVVGLGIVLNNRRLAYVELALMGSVVYLMLPWRGLRRRLTRWGLVLVPLVLLYGAVGWDSTASVFKPVRVARTILSPDDDGSTKWREMENANLIGMVRRSPVLGSGFGHEYEEVVEIDSLETLYAFWKYIPHNTLLGLLGSSGALGFSALVMLLAVGAFLAARGYARARRPEERSAALLSLCTFACYLAHAYGDMGTQERGGAFLLALALTLAGKVAVLVGAWPGPTTERSGSGAGLGLAR